MASNKRMKEKKVKEKKKGKFRKFLKFIKVTFITFFIIGIILAGVGAGLVMAMLNDSSDIKKEDFKIEGLNTILYDRNGTEIAMINNGQNRLLVDFNEMPPLLPKAFIAIEDERFDTHFGVDIKRTLAATFTWITNKGSSSFGGSTITQQLVKNVTDDKDSRPDRKIREMVRAYKVENWLTKDQILELYLNLLFLGGDVYGVQTAAYNYYDKDVKELTIAECAMLAGITHMPNSYNPFKEGNYDKIKKRQETVLYKMRELGYISQEEYDEAVDQELVFKKGKLAANTVNSYFVEAAISQAIEDLQEEKGISKAMAKKMVYSDGLRIYTTMDPKTQETIDNVYKNSNYFGKSTSELAQTAQSAMVIMDHTNGEIVGLIGGAGEKEVELGLNRAISSYRQLGSCIKPLAAYGPGIDKKLFTAATPIDDVPTTYKIGSSDWTLKNWYTGFKGLSTVRSAIEQSINVTAARAVYEYVGVDTSYEYMERLGFTSLRPEDKAPAPLSLGGLTKGVSPMEVAGAYSTIANNGEYIEPKVYTKITDSKGNIVLNKQSKTRQVFSEQTSFILKCALREVVEGSNGTFRSFNLPGNIQVCAKTGTTSSDNDRWLCGFTPYYTAVVWYGYDKPETIYDSGNPAGRIWGDVIKEVHKGLPAKSFEEPEDIVWMTVCKDSGMLPCDLCSSDQRGNRLYKEAFIKGTEPTTSCIVHVAADICQVSNQVAGNYCPLSVRARRVFINRMDKTVQWQSAADSKYELSGVKCTVHNENNSSTTINNGNTTITIPNRPPVTVIDGLNDTVITIY